MFDTSNYCFVFWQFFKYLCAINLKKKKNDQNDLPLLQWDANQDAHMLIFNSPELQVKIAERLWNALTLSATLRKNTERFFCFQTIDFKN